MSSSAIVTAVDITGFGGGLYWTADNIDYTAVPEPAAPGLFGIGLLGLGLTARRRKSRQA